MVNGQSNFSRTRGNLKLLLLALGLILIPVLPLVTSALFHNLGSFMWLSWLRHETKTLESPLAVLEQAYRCFDTATTLCPECERTARYRDRTAQLMSPWLEGRQPLSGRLEEPAVTLHLSRAGTIVAIEAGLREGWNLSTVFLARICLLDEETNDLSCCEDVELEQFLLNGGFERVSAPRGGVPLGFGKLYGQVYDYSPYQVLWSEDDRSMFVRMTSDVEHRNTGMRYLNPPVGVEPDQSYVLLGRIRWEASGHRGIGVVWYRALPYGADQNAMKLVEVPGVSNVLKGEWSWYGGVVQAPADAHYASVLLMNKDADGAADFDDVILARWPASFCVGLDWP